MGEFSLEGGWGPGPMEDLPYVPSYPTLTSAHSTPRPPPAVFEEASVSDAACDLDKRRGCIVGPRAIKTGCPMTPPFNTLMATSRAKDR